METSEGVMPRREQVWVQRAIATDRNGIARWWHSLRLARKRINRVRQSLAERKGTKRQVKRMVVIGAALELRSAKKEGVEHRIYVSDVEVNHLAHRLALPNCTDILLPHAWREDIDAGLVEKAKRKGIRLHGFPGNKSQLYLRPMANQREGNGSANQPSVFMRSINGGGVHDSGEPTQMPEPPAGWHVEYNREGQRVESAWQLPNNLLTYDGVITQSVSLATEALSLGVPTLLCSRAERGVLDQIEKQGGPLVRWPSEQALERWTKLVEGGASEVEWPDVKGAWEIALTSGIASAP